MSAASLVVSSLSCGIRVTVSPCARSCTTARSAANAEAGSSTSMLSGLTSLAIGRGPAGDARELLVQLD